MTFFYRLVAGYRAFLQQKERPRPAAPGGAFEGELPGQKYSLAASWKNLGKFFWLPANLPKSALVRVVFGFERIGVLLILKPSPRRFNRIFSVMLKSLVRAALSCGAWGS